MCFHSSKRRFVLFFLFRKHLNHGYNQDCGVASPESELWLFSGVGVVFLIVKHSESMTPFIDVKQYIYLKYKI